MLPSTTTSWPVERSVTSAVEPVASTVTPVTPVTEADPDALICRFVAALSTTSADVDSTLTLSPSTVAAPFVAFTSTSPASAFSSTFCWPVSTTSETVDVIRTLSLPVSVMSAADVRVTPVSPSIVMALASVPEVQAPAAQVHAPLPPAAASQSAWAVPALTSTCAHTTAVATHVPGDPAVKKQKPMAAQS